jgi:hypothetical protein
MSGSRLSQEKGMSNEEHSWNAKELEKLHKRTTGKEASIVDGAGACLNRHNSNRNKRTGFLTKSSCNYRWQAFRRALDIDKAKYNWPAYESIQELVQKTRRGKARTTIDLLSRTKGGTKRHPVPNDNNKAWDITADGKNFQTQCTKPYWHESHHIIPNGEFQASIAEAGKGEPLEEVYVGLIRAGLLREKYNLNHMNNMIILPMAKEVAYALGLPRHRVSRDERSHVAYSNQVRADLDKIFKPIQKQVKEHRKPPPDYDECKQDLEELSELLREGILSVGAALKAMGKEEMENNSLDGLVAGSL